MPLKSDSERSFRELKNASTFAKYAAGLHSPPHQGAGRGTPGHESGVPFGIGVDTTATAETKSPSSGPAEVVPVEPGAGYLVQLHGWNPEEVSSQTP